MIRCDGDDDVSFVFLSNIEQTGDVDHAKNAYEDINEDEDGNQNEHAYEIEYENGTGDEYGDEDEDE